MIEFNCRFGDPETEVVLPRLQSDIYAIFEAIASGKPVPRIFWSDCTTMGFVMASKGYPGEYEKGFEITGLDHIPSNVKIYHMGTKLDENGKTVTSGGRVLMVVGMGEGGHFSPQVVKADLHVAHDRALWSVQHTVKCDNLFYRRDIGWRVLE